MAADTVRAAVRQALTVVLGREFASDEVVVREREAKWDSLTHMEIVFTIEDALGIQFDETELPDLNSEAALIESAERHGAA